MNLHSKVHITKLAAVERQLGAAIRMFFAREDSLAVHTVAAAAYQLLTDLKAKQRMSEAADTHLTAIFYAIRSFRRGALPKRMTEDPSLIAEIARLAELLPVVAESKVSDFSVTICKQEEQGFWSERHKAANFLKHADRDCDAVLAEDDIDNVNLLMQAIGAYQDLLHRLLLPEGLVLWLYFCAQYGDSSSVPERFQPILSDLVDLDEDERYVFCAAMIRELAVPGSAA